MDLDAFDREVDAIFQKQAEFCQAFLQRHGGLLGIDAFLFSGFDRAVALTSAFRLVCAANLKSVVFPIVRMQYDSVLRSWGILRTENPFVAANRLIAGERFDRLVDRDGRKLRDGHLVREFSVQNPWFREMYSYVSSWVHLSHEHVADFLSRAEPVPNSDEYTFAAGTGKLQLEPDLVENLSQGVVCAVSTLYEIGCEWDRLRPRFGSQDELLARYATKN